MNKGLIAALTIAFCLFYQPSVMATEGELYYLSKSGKPIKVFVGDFVNESGKSQIKTEEFKGVLEESLINRKSVKFEVVNTLPESDIYISGIIRKFQYLEKGPMKVSPSAWGMALDAAASATQNYAEMEAIFTVTDSKSNKVLWSAPVYDYKKKVMTHDESIPVIYDEVNKIFLAKTFGRPPAEVTE